MSASSNLFEHIRAWNCKLFFSPIETVASDCGTWKIVHLFRVVSNRLAASLPLKASQGFDELAMKLLREVLNKAFDV